MIHEWEHASSVSAVSMEAYETSTNNPFASMVVSARSPDQQISAEFAADGALRLVFRPGAYQRYHDEATLANQLGQLASLVWVAYRRRFLEVLSEATGETVDDVRSSQSPRDLAYRRELEALPLDVRSRDGLVRLRTEGLLRWRMEVARGARRQLSEEQFVESFVRTFRVLLDDYQRAVSELKGAYFGGGLQRASHQRGANEARR